MSSTAWPWEITLGGARPLLRRRARASVCAREAQLLGACAARAPQRRRTGTAHADAARARLASAAPCVPPCAAPPCGRLRRMTEASPKHHALSLSSDAACALSVSFLRRRVRQQAAQKPVGHIQQGCARATHTRALTRTAHTAAPHVRTRLPPLCFLTDASPAARCASAAPPARAPRTVLIGYCSRRAPPAPTQAHAHAHAAFTQTLTPCRPFHFLILPPCSDAWMGDTGPNNATWGYAFRGQRIITAALTQLVQQHGMGLWPAGAPGKPRLLFGGCSAGARGAMVNLDRISATLNSLGVDMQARPSRIMTWQGLLRKECVFFSVLISARPRRLLGCWTVACGWTWRPQRPPQSLSRCAPRTHTHTHTCAHTSIRILTRLQQCNNRMRRSLLLQSSTPAPSMAPPAPPRSPRRPGGA